MCVAVVVNPMETAAAKKSNWVFERSSGYAGFRCIHCATWKYASEFLICPCDEEKDYLITGPVRNEDQTYWHNDYGWITEFGEATTLPKQILTSPLPPGATGIMELTPGGPVAFYPAVSPPTGGVLYE